MIASSGFLLFPIMVISHTLFFFFFLLMCFTNSCAYKFEYVPWISSIVLPFCVQNYLLLFFFFFFFGILVLKTPIFEFFCGREANTNKPSNIWKPSQRPGKAFASVISLLNNRFCIYWYRFEDLKLFICYCFVLHLHHY